MQGRAGERKTSIEGQEMILAEYLNTNNVTVIFKEDNSTQKTTYARFKSGNVIKNDTKLPDPMIGKDFVDAKGQKATVIERNGDGTLVVGYSDGEIISGVTAQELKTSNFSPSKSETMVSTIVMGKDYRKESIKAERKATLENALYLLNRYRKCIMIRPCGFGKTWIGMKIFSMPQYRKCLFLHPMGDDANVERIKRAKLGSKVTCKTYAWLRGLSDEKIAALDYDLVFLDECHGVVGDSEGKKGAVVTYAAIVKLMKTHPKSHFLGATATPFRMDGIDVVDLIFHGHACYPYTDADAFADGILKKPNYYYCVADVVKKVRDAVSKESKEKITMTKEEIVSALKLGEDDVNELDARYMDEHLPRVCANVFGQNKNYFRFIAFYLTNDEIKKNRKKVESWFRKAYPDYEINSLVVTARSSKSLKDVDSLPTKPSSARYKGRVDIVFNCEMLCTGYHSELIDGLIIDRATKSLAKYMQMIGRLLSCDFEKPVVIFDIADNIHAEFIYNVGIPDTEIKKEITGEPVVNKTGEKETSLTYEGILAANPNAIDWDEVEKTKEKVKLVNETIAEISGEDISNRSTLFCDTDNDVPEENLAPSKTEYVPNTIAPFEPKAKVPVNPSAARYFREHVIGKVSPVKNTMPKTTEEVLKRAKEVIKEKNMSLIEAGEYIQEILDKEIPQKKTSTASFSAKYADTDGKNSLVSRQKEDKLPISVPDRAEEELLLVEELCGNSEVEEYQNDNLGYSEWTYYYNPDNGEMYSKNVNVLNKQIDFEAELTRILREVATETMNAVIERWHTYPGCEENYSSYAEVDTKNTKYRMLCACADVVGHMSPEPVLQYMIVGIA